MPTLDVGDEEKNLIGDAQEMLYGWREQAIIAENLGARYISHGTGKAARRQRREAL